LTQATPIVPSLAGRSFPWTESSRQPIRANEFDQRYLAAAFNTLHLASDLARRVLLSNAANEINIIIGDLSAELRGLVTAGRVDAARATLSTMPSTHPAARRWEPILTPPTTTPATRAEPSDFNRNASWLKQHRSSFFGEWVALSNGELVDHDKSRLALHRRLEAAGKLRKGTLFTKVD
jgi:hypothetical protein